MPLRRGGRGGNRGPLSKRGGFRANYDFLIFARLPAVHKEPTGFGKDSNAFVQKT
jgi:hypothetical protein